MELTESQMTVHDIAKTQGTRLQDLPPWMTYAASFEEKIDPKLEEEIKQYSERRHEKSSSQNEEEFCKQKEINDEISKQYQWLNPEEYKEIEPRIGKIITHADLINTLRSAGVRCWYVEHPHIDKLTLLVSDYWAKEMPKVACWVPFGYMPELSVSRFDEHGIPTNEKYRGWRTCLMQLLLHKCITEEQITKYFPPPKYIKAFHKYNQFLYDMRNSVEL